MKRRDFMRYGLGGLLLPVAGSVLAASKPDYKIVVPLSGAKPKKSKASTAPSALWNSGLTWSSFMVQSDGTVKAVGANEYGQLGDGNTTNSDVSVTVSGLSGVQAVAAGRFHTAFLLSDGTVKAVGWNKYGQLGVVTNVGTSNANPNPVTVSGLSGVQAIAVGNAHTVFLLSDGTVRAVGSNQYGQLGDGKNTGSNANTTPVTVSGLSGVQAIAAGAQHTVFLLSDGTVQAVGSNFYGQLGDGKTAQSDVPVTVSGLSSVQAIAAGSNHTVFLLSDGTVKAVGSNGSGQLGDGTSNYTNTTPVTVSGLSGVQAIAAGQDHTVFLLSDGTVMAVGNNGYGQLGDGKTINSDVPVTVSGLSSVQAIAAGYFHTVFLLSDGTVKAVGYNSQGQLGDGNFKSPVTTPVTSLL